MNITHRSMAKGINVLKNAGYGKPKNANEMYSMLEDYVKSEPKNAIISLSKIHPDAQIIIKSYDEWKLAKVNSEKDLSSDKTIDKFANCSGCVSNKTEIVSAAGDPEVKPKISSTTLIVAGAVVISISLIAAIVISKSK